MNELLTSIGITVVIVFVFRFINTKHRPPIFGIYQQRNKTYWFKFLFMYTFLSIRKLFTYLKSLLAAESVSNPDGTARVKRHDVVLEELHDLGDHSKAVDAVYFNGICEDGNAVICGLARRQNQMCDSFVYIRIHNEDLYLSPSLPDTYVQKLDSDGKGYSVKGLTLTNFIPMRAWTVCYSGEMRPRHDPSKVVKVVADLKWSANWAPFEYDTQMSPLSVADDMAREPWSKDYFKLLKKMHQTHYEQMGCLSGTVLIDDKKYELNMPSIRDHSFGPLRDWRNFHRYVYHFMFLENGDSMAVGSVSQPATLSHVTIGYLCRKDDQSVVAVDSSDYQLYHHAENQKLPKDYGFIFKAGGKSYTVLVNVFDEDQFYIGKDREAKLYERWCDVEVNGVKGKACVEWHYNNTRA